MLLARRIRPVGLDPRVEDDDPEDRDPIAGDTGPGGGEEVDL
jgi:hypothetical protein